MRQTLEKFEQFTIDVILDKRSGVRAGMFRVFLSSLSKLYGSLVDSRLWLYRNRILRERNLGCLVVSIGNLTVGGTGKTPVVEKFARSLQDGGRRVAILSRGYKSVKQPFLKRLIGRIKGENEIDPPRVVSDGKSLLLDSRTAGDEPYMLAANLKDVPVVVDKDRVKSGKHAISELNCDTLLLDDGLQYLRLKHRLDIVLVDRWQPFGTGKLLPRGTLREPTKNLKRASYIFITKCNGDPNDELVKKIRTLNRTAEIIECEHRPQYLQHIETRESRSLEDLKGARVGTVSAIAVPESFEHGVKKLGATIEVTCRFMDHHRFTEQEIIEFINNCVEKEVDCIITTEKDAVRFPRLARMDIPIYFLRVEIGILSNEESFDQCINRICQPPKAIAPPRTFF
ncbi:MAG: tetraacyldisaccharide 4'-kinase [Verrucomicrobiales bacterium]|nr:tetraacyldisaccharide 4'-kinase [Verrucomicrobiales bacterium]